MPMSARLLRPRQTIHPETADWANRVRTNGGSVSGTTLSAVDRFVKAIHAAGIRDRFYRLNLFAGTGLAAALVPLFRNTSLAGAVLGSTTDTNAGSTLFVSGDFSETVGLHANGSVGNSAKYLDTGLPADAMPAITTGHLGVFRGEQSANNVTTFGLIGTRIGVTQIYEIRQTGADFGRGVWGGNATSNAQSTADASKRLMLVTRTSSTALNLYANATSAASNATSTTPATSTDTFLVFNRRSAAGTVAATEGFPNVISSYSIGEAMVATQVSAYHAALAAFNTAMGR